MTHLHFVVNPLAGAGKPLAAWNWIAEHLPKRIEALGLSIQLSQSFVQEAHKRTHLPADTVLVSVGGDGSVHYLANEVLQSNRTLGIIPVGTGNDFARNLGLPLGLADAAEVLLTGTRRAVDSILLNGVLVCNVAGFGLDAEVVHWIEAHPSLKRLGRIGYTMAVPAVLWRHEPFKLSLQCDGGDVRYFERVSLFIVANGSRFGGGMKIAPMADTYDGQLDIIIASGLTRRTTLGLFPQIYKGTHVQHPAVTVLHARHVHARFQSEEILAEYDGERYTPSSTVEIGVLSNLHIVLPPYPRTP